MARKRIKILDEFLSGTWLNHNQLFGLATNLIYTEGGYQLMIITMVDRDRIKHGFSNFL